MSEKFETVEIPFQVIDGRQCLTGFQLVQEPWLKEFVNRFPHCFEPAMNRDVLWYNPQCDA